MSAQPDRPFRFGRLMKIVRRVHMYAGLMLLPWMLLFGISGMLFNHPNIGEPVSGERVGEADFRALTKLRPWNPQQIAERVVAQLNTPPADGTAAGRFKLDPTFASELTGFSVLSAKADDGQYMLLLDVQRAAGVLVTRKSPPAPARSSSFPARQVQLPEFTTEAVQADVAGLLSARHLRAQSELLAHPKIAPELRFQMIDAEQQRWNMTYDARTGMVAGRHTDSFPELGVTQLLANLHKTHHFPLQVGATWFWALFADLLGITMVLWAITGLAMWWQMKPTRVIGAVSLAIALGIAALVMGGTVQHLTFGDVKPKTGPGE